MDPSEAERLRQLEERVSLLEAVMHRGPAPVSAAPPAGTLHPAVPPAAVEKRAGGDPMWGAAAAVAAGAGFLVPKPAAVPSAEPRSLRDLEEQLSGRLLAWVGGIALIIGGAFFLSLAFSRGWIGPEARVVIGLVASAAALVAGAWLFERGRGTPALVLVAVGVSVGMLAFFAASQLYGLISPEVALVGSLVVATGAAAIAIRADSRAVAVLGLLAATLAPPIMGGPVTIVTVVLLGAALVGTSLIAAYRPWAWLPALAFVTTSPQLASWLFDQSSIALALAAIAAYWLVNALGATGYALRRPRPTIHAGSALHLVGLGLFSLFALRDTLVDQPAPARFVALMVLAVGYALLAGPFVRRSAWREPMAVLLSAIAIGVVVMTIALEIGGVARPLSWTAITLALAWVAVRFSRPPAAIGAGVVGSLVVLDVLAFMYPIQTLGEEHAAGSAMPFTSPEGIAVLAIAGAVAALGWWSFAVLRGRPRAPGMPTDLPELVALAGGLGAGSLIAYAAMFELGHLGVVLAWSAGAAAAFGLGRLLSTSIRAFGLAYVAGVTLIVMAAGEALTTIAPPSRLAVDPSVVSTVVPLVNETSLGLAAIALALVAGVLLIPARLRSAVTVFGRPSSWAVAGTFGAAFVVAYLGSIAVVDAFAGFVNPVNGDAALEIATQAQVALTIAWVVAGAVAFAAGIVANVAVARVFGLSLLTLATLKLFIVDLASVDVSYRVLSFIGVGVVLLGSSFLATRRRAGRAGIAEKRPV